MIFEREGARYRVSMDRREALDFMSRLAAQIKDGLGAYPITTTSYAFTEKLANLQCVSSVLLVTVDPKLYERRIKPASPTGPMTIKPERKSRGDPR